MTTLSWLGDLANLIATPLLPSHYIALVRPLAATHTRRARVEAVHDEAPGVRTLVLRPGRGWRRHRAGQHVRIGVAIAGRIATRTFSVSSSPDRRDGCFTITVKAQGRVSRALVRDVEVGTFVAVGTPEGSFVIPEAAAVRPLFITGGSGITPVASMLRTFALRGTMPDVVHVHYARTHDDVIFGEELRAIAVDHPSYRLIAIATADDPRRFSAARLDELVGDWRTRTCWACGPQTLLDAVTRVVPRVQVERFRAALAVLPATSGGRVSFAASGVHATADGQTPLLQVAEAAGLSPPHGCRMGICHTCDTTLISGRVRDLRTGTALDEPGSRIQPCVCAAAGDVELGL
ncbi:MAG TPA: ferredoxin reductase [Kofleriaceae bacterium]|nr:ferredoxin reductase [Kofleriaceae bacterium]